MQSKEALTKISGAIKGHVLGPDDSGYEARQVWNAMIDRHPAVIVQPANGADVAPAIKFARDNALEISIRGAGHNIAGNAICTGGLTVDFSQMKQVRVDAAKKRAYVDAGATLSDLDSATQRHGFNAGRHQLDNRDCRVDSRWRFRLAHSETRPDHRQSGFD
jgi:FAD/FMN-containing dehydrogenase